MRRVLVFLLVAVAVAIPASIGRGTPPPPGLVAAYGFEEGSGASVADSALRGNTGTISGATRVVGRFGQGVSFDGVNDWVTVLDAPSLHLTSALTLEAWVLPTKLGALWRTAVLKENGAALDYALYASGRSASVPSGNVYTGTEFESPGTSAIPLNQWSHLATTYDGATLRLYVNGALIHSEPASGPVRSGSGPLRLGGNSVWDEWLAGRLDEVRIYDRSLSATEIQSDMTTPVVADTTPPTVTSTFPADGAADVPVTTPLHASFDEAMDAASISGATVTLRSSTASSVAATVSYDAVAGTATIAPSSPLAYDTTYTATVSTGAADLAGNHLAAARTWSFTTAPLPPPVLVVTNAANRFSQYVPKLLEAEGLNAFETTDLATLTPAFLSFFDVVVLGEASLTAAQISMLSSWVQAGGNLIALRPDKQLAGLLGLTDAGGTLANGYVQVDTSSGPGRGIVGQTIQYHGTADRYTLADATGVATLFSSAAAATSSPAVTLRSVGTMGGQAAAFTYDLARSVVLTRQGNPAWAGQDRDGIAPARTNDLFYGASTADPRPDWVDLDKVSIPQADEQQRLLANLVERMDADRMPLPRFWYLPFGKKAAVVMTGDDHAFGGTAGRFDDYRALSPPGCSLADWECVRATSYVYPNSPLTDAQAAGYSGDGFEVALHVNTDCLNEASPDKLDARYSTQLGAFAAKYPSVPTPLTERTHCIAWDDWASQPKIELAHGIRLDTNYYYYPAAWAGLRPGLFTGSGFPQPFADLDGTPIDVYQAPTQLTDESGQAYPETVDALLNAALGPQGYYGVFTANSHTDKANSPSSDAIVASAQSRGVPIVSAKQMLAWLDARNASSFGRFAWSGNVFGFSVTTAANGLQAMLPLTTGRGTIATITRNGTFVPFTTRTIKGIDYAVIPAPAGRYEATLDTTNAPRVTTTAPASDATGVATTAPVQATFSRSLDPATVTASTFTLTRPDGTLVPAAVSYDDTTLTATLAPAAALSVPVTYTARLAGTIGSADGATLLAPVTWSFTTGPPRVLATFPVDGSTSASRSAAITATFSAGIDPATLTTSSFTLTQGGTAVAASVSYDAARRKASLQPAGALVAGATYRASLDTTIRGADGTPLAAAVSWTFTASSCPCTLFPANPTPSLLHLSTAGGAGPGTTSLEVGVKVKVDQAMTISALRFYKDSAETGLHVGRVWSSTGTLLGQTTFAGETGSGWQRQTLPTPLHLQAGATYIVSVNANSAFAQTLGGLAAEISNGPLHSVADGQNGVYGAAAGSFPNQSYGSSDYGVDVEVVSDGEPLPPVVTMTVPADGATAIAPSVVVTATFSRALDPSTVNSSTFTLTAAGGGTVPATVSYDAATTTARLMPSAPLALGASYTAHLGTDILGTTGAPLGAAVQWTFEVAATEPPPVTVLDTLPIDGASDIGAAIKPRAYFSKPLQSATLSDSVFTLTGPTGAVPAAVSYDAATNTLTAAPATPLTLGATYTARVSTSLAATDGTHLAADHVWSFSTPSTAPGAPTVVSTTPLGNATSVAQDSAITARFSISLDPATVNTTTFTLARSAGGPNVPATVSYDAAARVATLRPATELAGSTDYTARVDGTTRAADGMAVGSAFRWAFSTSACPCRFYFDSDTPSFQGLSTVNGDGAGSTSLELGVKITVDEPMRLNAIRFFKSLGETGTHVGRLWNLGGLQLGQATFASETASGWQQANLAAPVLLQPGVAYVVSVNANERFAQTVGALTTQIISGPLRTVTDGANAVFSGAAGVFPTRTYNSSSYYIDPLVVVEGSPPAPTVSSQLPAPGATLVPTTAAVRTTFSRSMSPATLDTLSVRVTDPAGTAVAGAVAWDDPASTVVFTPAAALDPTTTYTATVSTRAKARDGVPLAAPVTWSFTTAPPPPTVSDLVPAAGTTGVARNATVRATFSKAIDPTTLSAFTLAGPGGAVPATVGYDAATRVATLSATSLLATSTFFTATVGTGVKATDGAAVATAVTWTFTTTADGTAPTTTITSGPSGATNSTSASFSFAADEPGSFECRLDVPEFGACVSPRTYSALLPGSHTFAVRATDAAGNTGAAATRTWTIDTKAPAGTSLDDTGATTFISSGPASLTNATSATFSFSANEPATFTCKLDTSPAAACVSPTTYNGLDQRTHTFELVATDAAGNASAPESRAWAIDLTAPVTTDNAPLGYRNGPVTVTLSASDTGGGAVAKTEAKLDGGSFAVTSSVLVSGEGSHTVTYRSTDTAGNLEPDRTATVRIDLTNPVTTDNAPTGYVNAPVTVTLSASDAGGSGVASTQYKLDSAPTYTTGTSLTVSSEGTHTLTYHSTDGAGNLETDKTATIRIDLTNPVVTFDSQPADPTNATTASFAFHASESSSFRCSLDGVPATACSSPVPHSSLDDRRHTFTVTATDLAGNTGTATSGWLVDTTPPSTPTLAFGGTANAAVTGSTVFYRPERSGGFTVAASSVDAESGIASYAYPSLGAGWTGAGAYSFVAGASDPVEPLTVTATNRAGGSASTAFSVTPDGAAPVTAIACNGAPCGAGYYTSAPVSVALTANDFLGSGVDKVVYTLDGTTPGPLSQVAYGAFPVNATTTVRFRAYDRLANEELVGSQLIRIDTTPPSAPVLTLGESSPYAYAAGATLYYNPDNGHTGTFTVDAASSDAESGIASIGFPAIAGMTGGGDTTISPYSAAYAWTAATTTAGAQTVTARNGAGLTASSALTVTPDTAAPAGGSVSYPDGYSNGAVTVTTEDGTDAGSGIDPTSHALERQTAALTDGTCGAWGSWLPAPSSDTVPAATCARYRLRISDRVANEAIFTSSAIVRVDGSVPAAPVLQLTALSPFEAITGTTLYYNPSGSNSGSFGVSATSSAASGIAKLSFSAVAGMSGGGDDTTSPYSTIYAWTSSTTASGPQTVTATSNAATSSSSTFTVTPDTAAPTGQTAALVGGPWYTTASIAVTTGDGSDALAGIDSSTRLLERNTASLAAGLCGSWSPTWTAVTSPDTGVASGTCVRYRFSVADRVGNRSAFVQTATGKVDTSAPPTPTLTFSAFTSAAATGSTVYFRPGVTGGFAVTATSSDPESGIAATTLPVLGSGWTTTATGYTFTAAAVEPGATPGVTVTNGAGLPSAAAPLTVTADGTGPANASVSYADGYRTTAAVALALANGSDTGSGIDTPRGQLQRADGTLSGGACSAYAPFATVATAPPLSTSDSTVQSGHCYQYRYVVFDRVGNSSTAVSSSTAQIDTEPPTAALADPGAYLRGTVALASTVGDTGGSGVAPSGITYERSSGTGWVAVPQSFDTTAVADGSYDLRVVAVDRAGNRTVSAVVPGRLVDNTAPSAAIVDPGAYLKGTILLSAATSDSGSGIASTTFQRSTGAGWTDVPATLDTTTLPDGLYDFQVIVVDRAGNRSTSRVTGRLVDNTLPAATMANPGATIRGTVSLTSTTSDSGSGVATVTYQRASGSSWIDVPATFDTTTLADGSYTLRALATDRAGNQGPSASVSTYVDNRGPLVVSKSPADGAGAVALGAKVTVGWSKAMDVSTLTTAAVHLRKAGVDVAAGLAYDTATNTTTLTPSASLAESTTYTVALDTSIKSSDGYALHDAVGWSFSTGSAPPTVTATSPGNGSTGVSVAVAPSATFNTALDATTVNTTSVTIAPQGGATLPATVTYDAAARTATVAPVAALSNATTYVVSLSAAILSTQGVALAPTSWSFTTVNAPPTIVSRAPADAASGVSVYANPSATFSRSMDATTLTGSTVTLTGPSGAVPATVSYSAATTTVTLKPSAALAKGTLYTARVDGTVKALDGVALGTGSSWSFTTTTAPEVTTVTPADGSSNQSMSTKPTAAFDMAIDTLTLTTTNVTMKRTDGTSVPINLTYDSTNKLVTIAPTTSLDYSMTYTVALSTGIKSTTGIPLASTYSWSFAVTGDGVFVRLNSGSTTGYTSSTGATYLADQYFSGGTTRSVTTTVSGTTDATLYKTSRDGLWNYTINVPNGTYDVKLHLAETQFTAVGARVFSVDVLNTSLVNDIANLDIFGEVGANKADDKTVANVLVTGRAVRLKAVAVTSNPTIQAIEVIPKAPTVIATTPVAGATGVAATAAPTMTFSQLMTASTINAQTVKLSGPSGAVSGTVTYDATNKVATFTPSAPLASGTYTGTVSGTKDYYGMSQQTPFTWSFTVA